MSEVLIHPAAVQAELDAAWQAARDAYQDRDEARADVDLLVEALRDVQDAHAQCCASLALARGRRA